MKLKRDISNYLVWTILLFILLFSTLPYGSVEIWSRNLVNILCLALFTLVVLFYDKTGRPDPRQHRYEKLCVFLFFILVILQVIPLPADLLGFIGGGNLHMWESNSGVLETLGFETKKEWYTISLYPHVTWSRIIELFALFAFGYSASRVCSSENKVRPIILAVFIVAIFQAVTGIIQFFSSGQGFATGTYVNRNHYAGILELSVFVLIGYVLSVYSKKKEVSGYRSSFLNYFTDDAFIKQTALIFVLSIAAVSLFLSFSRMGIISFLIALTFMHFVNNRLSSNPFSGNILIFGFIISGFLYVILIGFHPLLNRFLDIGHESSGRLHVWSDSLRIVRDFPLFGTGLGTFKYIHPQYKTLEKAVSFNYAHNDYLQLMVETGTAGFLFMMTALVLFFRRALIRLKTLARKGDQFSYFVKLGALSGIVSILVHSLADFNLHIPANAIFFSLMVGIVLSERKE